MKKIFIILATMIVSIEAVFAHDVKVDGVYYNIDYTTKTATVTYFGYDKYSARYSGEAVIPEKFVYDSETYYVTSIDDYAFYDCSKLTSVTIPNSVTNIGNDAFYHCSGLTSVTIPNSVISIGNDAFESCFFLTEVHISDIGKWCQISFSNLASNPLYYAKHLYLNDKEITELVIPEDVTSIGNYTFYNCIELTSVTIGSSVTSIGDYAFAFYRCSGLTSVTIPKSVTSIGDYAFQNCCSLTSITIPDSVTSIGRGVFEGCSSLTSIKWNAIHCSDFSNLNTPFYSYYGQYSSDNYSPTSIKEVTFGDKVEYIPACLCKSMSNLTSITIPNSVVSIGGYAFYDCSSLASATIGKNVKSIEGYAFRNCSSLTSITIPNSVTIIGDYAFYGCGLTSIIIPNSVTSIGNYAFKGCSWLTSVTIPDSVNSIGLDAFSQCSKLTSIQWNAIHCEDFTDSNTPFYSYERYSSDNYSPTSIKEITFGDNVEYIPAYLCQSMSNLTSITIPNSVVSIGKYTFYDCSSLASATIGKNVKSIEGDAFRNCSSLTSIAWNAIHCDDFTYDYTPFYSSSITEITFGEEVEYIPTYLCRYMSDLTFITIPNSVTNIGGQAFYGCSSLTSITIPNSVTNIGEHAFYGCSSLTSITIPDSVTSIGSYTFYGCSSLASATIGEKVKSIGDYAFSNCSSLFSLNIGEKVKSIGNYAFYNCSSLTSITIPDSVTSIGSCTFYDCSSLASATIGKKVKSIGDNSFYNCSSLTSITIPDSVTYIGRDAFTNCNSLDTVTINSNTIARKYYSNKVSLKNDFGEQVKIYILGEHIKTIGKYAFNGCNSLVSVIWNAIHCEDLSDGIFTSKNITRITFGDKVEHIPAYLCHNMYNLESIIIPESVTSIGDDAFTCCPLLDSVIWNAIHCEDFTSENSTPFYRPLYESSTRDYHPTRITEITFGDKVEYIPAYLCGAMYYISSITIPESVTSIGSYAFYRCKGLSSATIGKNVKSIGDYTFYGCSSLTSITIPNSVANIGSSAFYGCSSLTSITIPDSVTSIGSQAFTDCKSLSSATIGKNVKSIGDYAFSNCSSLTSITITDSVTSIGSHAFYYCGSLASVAISKNVTNIEGYTFYGCGSLTSIIIPENVTNIGDYAFYNCSRLTTITIPENVTDIGDYAFSNYLSYYINSDNSYIYINKNVYMVSQTPPSIGESVFSNATIYVPCNSLERYNASKFSEYNLQYPPSPYTIILSCNSENSGSIEQNTNICVSTITAIPKDNYLFSHWNDGNTDNPRTFDFTQDTTFTAYFIDRYENVEFDCIKYTIDKSAHTATVSGYTSECGNTLVIPSVIYYDGNEYTVMHINDEAFNESNFMSITIPETVLTLGSYAFGRSRNLTEIKFLSPTPPTLNGRFIFLYVPGTIRVPCGSMNDYIEAWGNEIYSRGTYVYFSYIAEEHRDLLKYSCDISVNNSIYGEVAIDYSCEMNNITLTATPRDENYIFVKWSDGNTDNPRTIELTQDTTFTAYFIEKYEDVDTVKTYEDIEFDCIKYTIDNSTHTATVNGYTAECGDTLVIPSVIYFGGNEYTVTRIGNWAFYESKFRSITIPETMISLGGGAFCQSYDLNELKFLSTTPSILEGGYIFWYVPGAMKVPCGSINDYIEAWGNEIYNRGAEFSLPRIAEVPKDLLKYSWNISVDNPDHGEVAIDYSETCETNIITLTATPSNKNYIFVKWSDGNTDNPRRVLVENNINLVAYFKELPDYEVDCIKYKMNDNTHTATVSGYTAECGDTLVIPSVINYDGNEYTVTHLNDGVFSGSKFHSITIPETMISLGYAAFCQSYDLNELKFLSTTPPTLEGGYIFWYVPGTMKVPCGSINDYIEAWGNEIYNRGAAFPLPRIAEFPKDFLTHSWSISISVDNPDYGEVAIDYSDICKTNSITLTATPRDENYIFVKWSDGNTDNPRAIELTQDTTFIAYFIEREVELDCIKYRFNINNKTAAVVGINEDCYPENIIVPSHVQASDETYVVNTIDNYVFCRKERLKSLILPETIDTLKHWAFLESKNLTELVFKSTTPPILDTDAPEDIFWCVPATITVPCGTKEAYIDAWGDSVIYAHNSFTNPAIAEQPIDFNYHIQVVTSNTEDGIVHIDRDSLCTNGTITISAEGYYWKNIDFTQWSDGNTDNPRTIYVDHNINLYAEFEEIRNNFLVAISVNDYSMGEVYGAGEYEKYSFVTCEARAYDGYEFVDWGNGITDNPYSFYLNEDTYLNATFREIQSGLDETLNGEKPNNSPIKYIKDNQIYILLPNGRTYNVLGAEVK